MRAVGMPSGALQGSPAPSDAAQPFAQQPGASQRSDPTPLCRGAPCNGD